MERAEFTKVMRMLGREQDAGASAARTSAPLLVPTGQPERPATAGRR